MNKKDLEKSEKYSFRKFLIPICLGLAIIASAIGGAYYYKTSKQSVEEKSAVKVFKYPGIKNEKYNIPGYAISYPETWNTFDSGDFESSEHLTIRKENETAIRIKFLFADSRTKSISYIKDLIDRLKLTEEASIISETKVDNQDAILVKRIDQKNGKSVSRETMYIEYEVSLKADIEEKTLFAIELTNSDYDPNKDYSEYNEVFNSIINSFQFLENYTIDDLIRENEIDITI